MDYLSVKSPDIFLQNYSDRSIYSLLKLCVVKPQLMDNKIWHAIYVRKVKKDETYRDNINWKRKCVAELSKSYLKIVHRGWGSEFLFYLYCNPCFEMTQNYRDIVSKLKYLITSDLNNNDEKFSSVESFNLTNHFLQCPNYKGDKWKWIILAWFEIEDQIAPFFNKELLSQVRSYLSKPIHPDWESVVLSMIETHGKSADKYIYEAGEMAQLTLFNLAKRTSDELVLRMVKNVMDLLISNQKPERINKSEIRNVDRVMVMTLRDFVHDYHGISMTDSEFGVALMLRKFILSDDLFKTTPPPSQYLRLYNRNKTATSGE